jgi:glycosyltransferase involved in cell wall biosynthesis
MECLVVEVRMHVLFIHQNFPAQFRYIAPRLVREHGWKCTFATGRAEGALPGIEKVVYTTKGGATKANHFCTQNFENAVWEAHAVYEMLKQRPDVQPDLIVAHTGFGSSLFLPYLYDAPIINFLELFYWPTGGDLGYRPELPVDEESLLRIKTKNAAILCDLINCDRGWCPTHYQRDFFPQELRSKIDVIFDGIDTAIYHRRHNPERLLNGKAIASPGQRIVTYVARGFERMRGFDLFMEASRLIAEQYPDVLFVVVGGDTVHYGPDLRYFKEATFREHLLATGRYDLSKYLFTGFVAEDTLAEILSISDLHIYLTEPFIASWSLVDAMSCGAVVLASDQRCVREYIEPGQNGLLVDFFDVEGLARQAVEVLRDPSAYRPLGEAASQTVRERYSVDVAMPRLKDFFEQVASKKRDPSTLLSKLVREGTLKPVISEEEAACKKQAARAGVRSQPPAINVAAASPAQQIGQSQGTAKGLKKSPLNLAADSPVRRNGAMPGSAMHEALSRLWQLGVGRATVYDWIQVVESYQGPAPFESLGGEHHPNDLARLMQRVLEWKPRLIVEIGTRLGGTLFLWTRVATFDCHLVASGLPDRPIPEERVPLFEAFGCGEQTIRSITRGEPAKLDYEMNKKCGDRLADFVFLNGRRPYDELKADLQRCLKWTRSGALIAWDGIRQFGFDETSLSGGMRLWQELQPRFPRHAEYLSGTSLPSGGIVAIVAK